MLGIWKAVEDTNSKNFIVVQDGYSIRHDYKLTDSQAKMLFDKQSRDGKYYITYLNREGRYPLYNQWGAVLSDIDGARFLTEEYSYGYLPAEIVPPGNLKRGYFFIRLVRMNKAQDTLVTAIVADTTLKYCTSAREVGRRMEEYRNKASFYSDTVHWYKINSYHYSINGSKAIANPR